MTNSDRLTKLFKQALLKWENLRNAYLEEEIDDIDNFDDVIIDYLLANGVIVPPCKVGDIVYKIVNDKRVKKPYKCKVIGFWDSEDETCNDIHLAHYVNGVFESSFSVPFTEIGKTVFLTCEEAEKALKERENRREEESEEE